MSTKKPTITDIANAYNLLVRNIDSSANDGEAGRAYGGVVRAGKGALVESMARTCIEIAWRNLGGNSNRLSFERDYIRVPIRKEYINKIKEPSIKAYIKKNIDKYVYKFKTDIHVHIDKTLAIGVECKAYTENAMMKRIAIDGMFLKQAHKNAHNVLFQLESQLGGDYSNLSKKVHLGSYPTHTILSYFDNVDLHIITLLEGERKVDQPIHKKDFYKALNKKSINQAVKVFEKLLKDKI